MNTPALARRPMLILAYAFPPQNEPGAARPFRFYRYLPEHDFQPSVITGSAQTSAPDRVYHVPDRASMSPRRSLRRLSEAAIRKYVFPDDGLYWALDALRSAEKLLATTRFAAVYSTSPSVNAHLAALGLKRRHGVPWIADFRDPLAGNPFRPEGGISGLLDRRLQSVIFRHADALVAVTPKLVDMWRESHPQYAGKMHVVWNGFDPLDLTHPLPIPDRNYKVLAHIGNLYGGRDPKLFMASLARLLEAGRLRSGSFRLRLVGVMEDSHVNNCRSLLTTLERHGCLEFENRLLDREQARRIMAESDYLLLADHNARNIGHTVPAKLYEYVHVGRPILATTARNSTVEQVLARCGLPYVCVHPDDPEEEIDNRIAGLFDLPSDSVLPSAWYEETFDGRRQAGTLAAILERIVR